MLLHFMGIGISSICHIPCNFVFLSLCWLQRSPIWLEIQHNFPALCVSRCQLSSLYSSIIERKSCLFHPVFPSPHCSLPSRLKIRGFCFQTVTLFSICSGGCEAISIECFFAERQKVKISWAFTE
jgi:hypothetical protein